MSKCFSRLPATKIGLFAVVGVSFFSAQLWASVSFNISAERLQDPGGFDMAESGVLVLVADTSGGGFEGASDSAFVTGDDYMIGKWDIVTGGGNTPGTFQGTSGAVSFSGDWGEGDPLAIYWFPTLSGSDAVPGAAVPYGMFDNGTLDGTDPWTTPADGTSGHSLIFLTTDAENLLLVGGSSDSAMGLPANVTPGDAPATPSGIGGEVSPGMVIVSWTDESGDETGFRVERSVSGSDAWEIIGSVGAGVTMFEDTAAARNTDYLYRVVAIRNASWSEYATSPIVKTPPLRSRLRNLSNRTIVGTGHERLIGSAIATGEPGTQVEVLVVVRGPSLAELLPADYTGNVLADPMVTLVDLETREEITNDDFGDWNDGEISMRFGDFIGDPKEAGAILTLDADDRISAIVEGVGGGTGMAQIEFYEIISTDAITEARLRNLSNRAIVGTGHERLIGSAIATGEPGTQVEVLVVVRGPSLAEHLPADYTGNVLADPMVTLVDLETREEITNDDFGDWNDGEISMRFGDFIKDPKEAGAILTLDADDRISAIVEGVGGGTGMAQIEFYELLPGQ